MDTDAYLGLSWSSRTFLQQDTQRGALGNHVPLRHLGHLGSPQASAEVPKPSLIEHPGARLGVFYAAECLSDEPQVKLRFHLLSVSTEHISVDQPSFVSTSAESILDKLDIGVSRKQQNELRAVVAKYIDVFASDDDDDLGNTGRVRS